MQVTAARKGRRLKVFENALYYPPIEEARALLQAGAIGAPLHCRLRTVAGDPRFAWRTEPSSRSWRQALWEQGTAGRLTLDDGHHKMAVALWLFGPVEEVFARIDWGIGPGGAPIDAPATLTWVHRQPRVHVMWDIVHAPRMRIRSDYYALDEVIEITGETGIIRVNQLTGRMLDAPALELYADGRLTGFHDLDSDWSVSFERSTAAFVEVVLGRADRWRLGGSAAREVLSLALTLEQSARNGSRMSAQAG